MDALSCHGLLEANLEIEPGERIAQGVFNEISGKTEVEFRKVIKLSDTKRGVGGFGSTGKG